MSQGSSRQLSLFNNYLNSIFENIKFTLEEIKENNSIILLDFTFIKENDGISYHIYRKPIVSLTPHTTVNKLIKVPISQDDCDNEYTTLKFIQSITVTPAL